MFVRINREHKYLRRAADQDGDVLDILLRSRRDAKAAQRFMAKQMKRRAGCPRCRSPTSSIPPASPPRGHAPSRAPLPQKLERPGPEQPPAHPATRTRDEGLSQHRWNTPVLSAFNGIPPHFRPCHHLMTTT
ncbi:DDE-type integrase/transposase/recombinase [Streptomyces prasinus]